MLGTGPIADGITSSENLVIAVDQFAFEHHEFLHVDMFVRI